MATSPRVLLDLGGGAAEIEGGVGGGARVGGTLTLICLDPPHPLLPPASLHNLDQPPVLLPPRLNCASTLNFMSNGERVLPEGPTVILPLLEGFPKYIELKYQ